MFKKLEKYKGEIWEYCQLNDISDIDAFVFQCFKQGYDIKKYGFLGNTVVEVKEVEVIKEVEIPTEIIKEVIVEKEVIKEVPVDKIVEVIVEKEVIKEIPVDKIVEVIVEKEVIKEIEKPIEVIVEREIIKEIPVDRIIEKEIIKEVEVIKEIPVDRIVEIIKEVEVEKIITKTEYISDKSGEDELLLKIQQLNEEVNTLRQTPPIEIIKEVEKEVIKEIPVDRVVEVIKEVPIDKIVEVIKEVPVDKIIEKEIIKEIEVIKEVPVDKIIEVIKEVPVDRIIEKEVIKEVVDNKTKEKMGLLQQTLQKLRQDNNDKDVEINKLNDIIKELEDGLKRTGAVFLKGSNINDKM